MAGHSHWANIKHKKAKVDAKRGKVWGKCVRAIMVAARNGLPDPDANLTLRYAVEEAKAANVPKETIERAIKKGAGELDGQNFESVRYEGYAAAGVAVMIDVLTDNRARTAPELRLIFSKYGGNLGATGCVAYLFEPRGVVVVEEDRATEEQIMHIAIDAGAEDVALEDGLWTVTCDPVRFLAVKQAVDDAGLEITTAELTMIPSTSVTVAGEDVGRIVRLVDALDDNDDVQKVYINMDASAEDLARAAP